MKPIIQSRWISTSNSAPFLRSSPRSKRKPSSYGTWKTRTSSPTRCSVARSSCGSRQCSRDRRRWTSRLWSPPRLRKCLRSSSSRPSTSSATPKTRAKEGRRTLTARLMESAGTAVRMATRRQRAGSPRSRKEQGKAKTGVRASKVLKKEMMRMRKMIKRWACWALGV